LRGAGGTSVFLAKELGARVFAITISHKQVEMATAKVDAAGLADSVTVFHGDGERLDTLSELQPHLRSFDAVWISEALSHFADRGAFFRHATAYLKPGGKLVLADWFRAEHISDRLATDIIKPIESGMLREYRRQQSGGWCEVCMICARLCPTLLACPGFG
jgi:tocopherol O-methyltransferase